VPPGRELACGDTNVTGDRTGLRSQLENPEAVEGAVVSVAVTAGVTVAMAGYHLAFGARELPFGVPWPWYFLGAVALAQALRIPLLSWSRRVAAFCSAVGVAVVLLGLDPTVACARTCAPRLSPSMPVFFVGVALTAAGTYVDWRGR